MPLPRRHLSTALLLGTAALLPGAALAAELPFTAADIEAAQFTGTDLPAGRSPLTAKVQMLLDRAGISPGVTDGYKGGMSESAIRAFERQRGLPVDGILDVRIWDQLQAYAAEPVTQSYTITGADAADLVAEIPADYAEKAQMAHMGYTSIGEKLGERFHMDEKFIAFLNPGVALDPGATITVMRPAKPLKAEVTRIIIDKATRRVAAYDARGGLVVDYPATVGSDTTPSPSGTHLVEAVALNPNYTYDPSKNFKQGENDKVLTVPPGPNGPVGTVWIDLSQPTYGIHGTPTPSRLFVNQSYGCVRLTNWDAYELAHMVKANVTTVEFLAPGQTIADVTAPPVPSTGIVAPTPPEDTAVTVPRDPVIPGRPLARPASVILAAAAAGATAAVVDAPAAAAPAVPTAAPDPLAAALTAASGGAAPVQPAPPANPPGAAAALPVAAAGATAPAAAPVLPSTVPAISSSPPAGASAPSPGAQPIAGDAPGATLGTVTITPAAPAE